MSDLKIKIQECGQAVDLFSGMLDGELAAADRARLEEHLLACEACRKEFDLWQKIADTLRSEVMEEQPSPDFCAGVMGRINKDIEAVPGRRFFSSWRTPAAAAAAAVMLFAGSWGVNVAMKPEKPGTVIVENQPSGETANGPSVSGEPAKNPQGGDTGSVSNPPAGDNSGDRAGTTAPAQPGTPAADNTSPVTVSNPVLLSNVQKDVLSTILKLSVTNTGDARNMALGLAARYGGGGQVLDTIKRGAGDLVIVRIAVPRESGKSLVSQLSGLGGVIDRADERRDISDSYNQAVNRLNDIQAKIGSGSAGEEKSRLEAEASGLKRQIAAWNSEAGSYVIMLWLEH